MVNRTPPCYSNATPPFQCHYDINCIIKTSINMVLPSVGEINGWFHRVLYEGHDAHTQSKGCRSYAPDHEPAALKNYSLCKKYSPKSTIHVLVDILGCQGCWYIHYTNCTNNAKGPPQATMYIYATTCNCLIMLTAHEFSTLSLLWAGVLESCHDRLNKPANQSTFFSDQNNTCPSACFRSYYYWCYPSALLMHSRDARFHNTRQQVLNAATSLPTTHKKTSPEAQPSHKLFV